MLTGGCGRRKAAKEPGTAPGSTVERQGPSAAGASGVVEGGGGGSLYAREFVVRYSDAEGGTHVYLVQEPLSSLGERAAILIYMHGAGGREEQGMTVFPKLRELLNSMGWVYVCPRDNEFDGLCRDLGKRYGERRLYLSGASAGGRWALQEAIQHGSRYSGLILMCPAAFVGTFFGALDAGEPFLKMPVWLVCGERDSSYAATCRLLAQAVKQRGGRVRYREIPGGDHDDPWRQIRWTDAIKFVSEGVPAEAGATPRQDGP